MRPSLLAPLLLAALLPAAAPAHAELEGTVFVRFRGTLTLPCYGCPGAHADGVLDAAGDGHVDGVPWEGDLHGDISYSDPACAAGDLGGHLWLNTGDHDRWFEATRVGPAAAFVLHGGITGSMELLLDSASDLTCGQPLTVQVVGNLD